MLTPQSLTQLANRFDTHAELAEALANFVAGILNAAVESRGKASVAFSGGSTPGLFFEALAARHVDWASVQVTLVDDRCVPPDSERSNAGMLQNALFSKLDQAPAFLPLFMQGESLQDCNQRLASLQQPFDCMVLGMGNDAHTASFFPDADNLHEMLDLADGSLVGETRSAASIERRLTFRLPTVLAARQVVLHICGQGKWQVLGAVTEALAKSGNNANAITDTDLQYPILSVLRRSSLHGEGQLPAAIYHADSC